MNKYEYNNCKNNNDGFTIKVNSVPHTPSVSCWINSGASTLTTGAVGSAPASDRHVDDQMIGYDLGRPLGKEDTWIFFASCQQLHCLQGSFQLDLTSADE